MPTHYREPGDLLWLLARHPLRCTRDLFLRRRLRREEWARPLREIAQELGRTAWAVEARLAKLGKIPPKPGMRVN